MATLNEKQQKKRLGYSNRDQPKNHDEKHLNIEKKSWLHAHFLFHKNKVYKNIKAKNR